MAKTKLAQLRVAIYTRVSTTEQAREGYSLSAQEKVLTDFCKLKEYEIVGKYSDEGISGKDIEHRPEMLRLLSDARSGKFDIILVWKLTRFTRRLADLTKTCDDLEKWGVYLVSYSEAFDSKTPAGRMVRSMLGTVAQFEREVIAENVKLGLDERARKGKRMCSQLLGYDIKPGKDGMIINPIEAQQVKFVFDNYLLYKNISQVTKLCNQYGFVGKRGKSPLPQTVYKILSRPAYCGYYTYCGSICKGEHEAIITVEQYNKVQKLLNRNGKIYGRKRIHELIYLQDI